MDVLERIKEQVENNPIIIYMKGTPQFPQCGFRRARRLRCRIAARSLPTSMSGGPGSSKTCRAFADWPTFPQVYIDGRS